MDKFIRLTGVAAPLIEPNVSTDAIIPSVWAIKPGVDLGAKLFANARYASDGSEQPAFVLNREPFRKARILLAGANFGCGSSREAAVWALQRFGIRCIIAPSFGEIFRDNMFKNGLLPIELPDSAIASLARATGKGQPLIVDLEHQMLSANGFEESFVLGEGRRQALLHGWDDIDQVMAYSARIGAFEAKDLVARPWIWNAKA